MHRGLDYAGRVRSRVAEEGQMLAFKKHTYLDQARQILALLGQ